MSTLSRSAKIKSAIQILVGGHIVAAGIATYTGNATWYEKVLMPSVQLLSPETSHWIAVKAAKYRLVPVNKYEDPPSLNTSVWGKSFSNPVGLAAGFDKQGEAVDGLLKMGFSFVEVGSVTPEPQPGNPKPRLFRLKDDKALINRYGLNSDGHKVVVDRLKKRLEGITGPPVPDDRNMLNENLWSPDRPTLSGYTGPVRGVIGVNLGTNRESEDPVNDYVKGVRTFGELADYLVINVSCPNVPGAQELQSEKGLADIISKVVSECSKLPDDKRPALLVKISPDLTEKEKIHIAKVVASPQSGVDGLIVSNTTVKRPSSLKSKHHTETGGLSGEPLKELATQTIHDMYQLTQGRLPIIGVGGVASGQDAYDKIRAGASLVQLYTSFCYQGPPLIRHVKEELVDLLEKDGYKNVSEAVGVDFRRERK